MDREDTLRVAMRQVERLSIAKEMIPGGTLRMGDSDLSGLLPEPTHKCVHAMESVGPYVVWLHVLDDALCPECAAAQLERLEVGRETRCDYCDQDREWFISVMIAVGPYTYVGEVCDICAPRFGLPVRKV